MCQYIEFKSDNTVFTGSVSPIVPTPAQGSAALCNRERSITLISSLISLVSVHTTPASDRRTSSIEAFTAYWNVEVIRKVSSPCLLHYFSVDILEKLSFQGTPSQSPCLFQVRYSSLLFFIELLQNLYLDAIFKLHLNSMTLLLYNFSHKFLRNQVLSVKTDS